jgi:hypothetical protein
MKSEDYSAFCALIVFIFGAISFFLTSSLIKDLYGVTIGLELLDKQPYLFIWSVVALVLCQPSIDG